MEKCWYIMGLCTLYPKPSFILKASFLERFNLDKHFNRVAESKEQIVPLCVQGMEKTKFESVFCLLLRLLLLSDLS